MGMILTPQGSALTQSAVCIICEQDRKLILLSAGMRDADGKQVYACDDHFRDTRTLVSGWTKYSTDQRVAHLFRFGLGKDEYGPSVY